MLGATEHPYLAGLHFPPPPARPRAGTLDTGETSQPDRKRWEADQREVARGRQRVAESWTALAERAARHARRLRLKPRALARALRGVYPPRGAIAEAELVLRRLSARRRRRGRKDDAVWQRARARLAQLRAWRRVALYSGRARRSIACGSGQALCDGDGPDDVATTSTGEHVVRLERCGLRTCPRCAARIARRRARQLGRCVTTLVQAGVPAPLLATLTMRAEPHANLRAILDVATASAAKWQRWATRQTATRAPVLDGAYLALEVVRSTPRSRRRRARELLRSVDVAARGGHRRVLDRGRWRSPESCLDEAGRLLASAARGGSWWHVHFHALLAPHTPDENGRLRLDLLDGARKRWQEIVRQEKARRGWRVDDGDGNLWVATTTTTTAPREVAKYVTKPQDLANLPRREQRAALAALDGLRTFSTSGCFRDLAHWVRECDENAVPAYDGDGEDEHAPDEPSEEDGEAQGAAAGRAQGRTDEKQRVWVWLRGTIVDAAALRWRPMTQEDRWRAHVAREDAARRRRRRESRASSHSRRAGRLVHPPT